MAKSDFSHALEQIRFDYSKNAERFTRIDLDFEKEHNHSDLLLSSA